MLNIPKPRRTLFAAVSSAALILGPAAVAQEHASPETHAAPSEAQVAEHHRQLTALLGALLAETDFDAVKAHVISVVETHADEIGDDPEALSAHVSEFLDQVAAHVSSDPEGAAAFAANMLIEAHRPH